MTRKKAPNGQGGIRKYKRNGVTYYDYRYTDPLTGQQTTKGTCAKTQAECLAKWDKIKASMTMGTFVSVDNKSFTAYLDEWLSRKINTVEHGTYTQYESVSRLYLKPLLGNIRLQDLRRVHCQDFVDRVSQKVSPKYTRNIVGVLTAALNDALKNDMISKNPAAELDLPEREKTIPVAMEDDTIQDFEKAAQKSPYKNIFLLAIHTGMRISEVLGLQWKNVHMKTGEIVISGQLQRKDKDTERQVKNTTKSHKTRSTYVPPFVIETVLKPERRMQMERQIKAGECWQNADGLVFTREDGSPMPHRTVENALGRIYAEIGHPEYKKKTHIMRKTFITQEENAGADIKALSDSVGHSTVAITLDVYTAVNKKAKQAAADRRQSEYEKRESEASGGTR